MPVLDFLRDGIAYVCVEWDCLCCAANQQIDLLYKQDAGVQIQRLVLQFF